MKKLLIGFAVIVILAASSFFIFKKPLETYLINTALVKVKDQLGIDIKIGEHSIGLLKGSVSFDDISIKPVNENKFFQYFESKKFQVNISWPALIQKNIVIDNILIEDSKLKTSQKFLTCFSALGAAKTTEAPAEQTEAVKKEEPAVNIPFNIILKKLTIKSMQILTGDDFNYNIKEMSASDIMFKNNKLICDKSKAVNESAIIKDNNSLADFKLESIFSNKDDKWQVNKGIFGINNLDLKLVDYFYPNFNLASFGKISMLLNLENEKFDFSCFLIDMNSVFKANGIFKQDFENLNFQFNADLSDVPVVFFQKYYVAKIGVVESGKISFDAKGECKDNQLAMGIELSLTDFILSEQEGQQDIYGYDRKDINNVLKGMNYQIKIPVDMKGDIKNPDTYKIEWTDIIKRILEERFKHAIEGLKNTLTEGLQNLASSEDPEGDIKQLGKTLEKQFKGIFK